MRILARVSVGLVAACLFARPESVAATPAARVAIRSVTPTSGGDRDEISIRFDGPTPTNYSSNHDSDNTWLEVDLLGVGDALGTREIAVSGDRIGRISVTPRATGTLIYVEAAPGRSLGTRTTSEGRDELILGFTGGAAWAAQSEMGPPPGRRAPAVSAGPPLSAGAPEPKAPDADASAEALPSDGLVYRVDYFEPQYALPHPDHPPLDEVIGIRLRLCETPGGFVAERPGLPVVELTLRELGLQSERRFHASAIRAIGESLVAELNRRGTYAVFVQPHVDDIDPATQRDRRPTDRGALRLVISTGRLLELRTFAAGSRIPEADPEQRTNHPLHQPIVDHSPVRAGDLVRKLDLDDYVARLSRHPGREVTYRLSQSPRVANAYLDYLVAESKPWSVYVQGANTGTEETGFWRERFGFSHTQLTGRDDILNLDYITGGFDEVHAVFGSYEAPVYRDLVRLRLGGSFSDYEASQLGQPARFDGTQWDLGFQLIGNVWQHESLFVDLFGGARFQHIAVDNRPTPFIRERGDADLLLPELGIRVERDSEVWRVRAALSGEWNLPTIAGTDAADDLAVLGRNRVDETSFELIQWAVSSSVFVDALLAAPGSDARVAHEIELSSRGQHSFGHRLAPQLEQVAGGVYSVRGYHQSIVAGDTLILGRGEYRLHLPRLLPFGNPIAVPGWGPLQLVPSRDRRPDWDLVLVTFFDLGRTAIAHDGPGEFDELLLSTGLGVEFRVVDNLILEFDWGRALREAKNGGSDGADHEFHFQGTLLY